ncbi:hypothetical protein ColTof4_07717 [Colletotrichum tofieldiae]|nr:hypothetical protein ColTof3_02756 [Colletotrichum tofieldiae]GKT75293.1 hypothetical protein ColTof4_07717 [Colletotrichum tofieldiae]
MYKSASSQPKPSPSLQRLMCRRLLKVGGLLLLLWRLNLAAPRGGTLLSHANAAGDRALDLGVAVIAALGVAAAAADPRGRGLGEAGLLGLLLGVDGELVDEPVYGEPEKAAEEGEDDEVDAPGREEEDGEEDLEGGEGRVGGADEGRGRAWDEDGLPEVGDEGRHGVLRRGQLSDGVSGWDRVTRGGK